MCAGVRSQLTAGNRASQVRKRRPQSIVFTTGILILEVPTCQVSVTARVLQDIDANLVLIAEMTLLQTGPAPSRNSVSWWRLDSHSQTDTTHDSVHHAARIWKHLIHQSAEDSCKQVQRSVNHRAPIQVSRTCSASEAAVCQLDRPSICTPAHIRKDVHLQVRRICDSQF